MYKYLAQLLGATCLLACLSQAGTILNFFPASDYNATTSVMDATLGLTGDTIDDFETTTLIPNLSYTLSGNGVSTTTFTSLPGLFAQGGCPGLTDNVAWDGSDAVINTPTNSMSSCTSPINIAQTITFNYAGGTSLFGIGFSNFQSTSSPSYPITNHELFVNGIDMGTLEALAGADWTPGLARNAYLEIDGTAGTLISSVEIENLSAADVLMFDHLAVSPAAIPEPSYLLPLVGCFVLFILRQRRRYASSGQ